MKSVRFGSVLVISLGIVLGIALNNTLIGCAEAKRPLNQFVAGIAHLVHGLNDHNKVEMDRFAVSYREATGNARDAADHLRTFEEVYRLVLGNYVAAVDDSTLVDEALSALQEAAVKPESATSAELMEASLDGMLQSLDPHSGYLNPEEAREMNLRTRGEFGGLGIEVSHDPKGVKVIAPIADTPAEQAGIQAGDIITHVDGDAIAGWELFQ